MNPRKIHENTIQMQRKFTDADKIDKAINELSGSFYTLASFTKEERDKIYEVFSIFRNGEQRLRDDAREMRWDISEALNKYDGENNEN